MKVDILATALCACRVCSDGSYEATLAWIRQNEPSGTANNWQEAPEILHDGTSRVVECANGNGRKHYVYNC